LINLLTNCTTTNEQYVNPNETGTTKLNNTENYTTNRNNLTLKNTQQATLI